MNKLTKDQIQKISLSALLMLGMIYAYFNILLAPLDHSQKMSAAAIAGLEKNIADAKLKISRTNSLTEQAKKAEEVIAQLNDQIPDGAPIAWFPPRMKAFFDRHNLRDTVIRPTGVDRPTEAELSDYKNFFWSIDAPLAKYVPLGIALAGLENEETLLEISRLQLALLSGDNESQRVSINVVTLLK